MLPITEVLVFAILYITLLRLGRTPGRQRAPCPDSRRDLLVLSCALLKRVVVGSQWGSDHSTPFWSWRHFSYFFAQDCFFAWCGRPWDFGRDSALESHPAVDGVSDGRRTIVADPLQAFDWNAVSFGDDCIIAGLLQFHTFENMTLKVKRTEIQNGSSVGFGATVMGGAVIEPDTTLRR